MISILGRSARASGERSLFTDGEWAGFSERGVQIGSGIFGFVGCLGRRRSRGRPGNVPIPGKAAGSDRS